LLARPSRSGAASFDEASGAVTRARFFRLTVAQRRRLFTAFPCTEFRRGFSGGSFQLRITAGASVFLLQLLNKNSLLYL